MHLQIVPRDEFASALLAIVLGTMLPPYVELQPGRRRKDTATLSARERRRCRRLRGLLGSTGRGLLGSFVGCLLASRGGYDGGGGRDAAGSVVYRTTAEGY